MVVGDCANVRRRSDIQDVRNHLMEKKPAVIDTQFRRSMHIFATEAIVSQVLLCIVFILLAVLLAVNNDGIVSLLLFLCSSVAAAGEALKVRRTFIIWMATLK